ncbi:Transmembrane emp24 domain-containing protein [Drosera capensis]
MSKSGLGSVIRLALSIYAMVLLIWYDVFPCGVDGLRFTIDGEECFSHSMQYKGDTVHFSFVVIKAESPWNEEPGVDLVVKGPGGEQVYDTRGKTSEKFEFVAQKKGLYRFCFSNKSPYRETVDFDIHVGHFYFDHHAKDEHLNPLMEQIAQLEEALYNIQFEQHWLGAQTDRQSIINEGMSRRALHKAFFESAALIGASVLQVHLLKRMFERKLATSRV